MPGTPARRDQRTYAAETQIIGTPELEAARLADLPKAFDIDKVISQATNTGSFLAALLGIRGPP